MTETTDIKCGDCESELVREPADATTGKLSEYDNPVLVCPGQCLEIKEEVN